MAKVAWIIGASSGIGRALSIKLSQEGYRLAVSARSSEPLSNLLKALKGTHHSIHPCDVSQLKTVQKAYQDIIGFFPTLDLIVFAAGIYIPMSLDQYDHKKSLETLEVNLTGAFNVFEVIKKQAFSKDHPLHLAWISSVAGYRGLPNSGAYGVSKAGLINFAETQRTELKNCNTKVQVINPGFVKTRLTDKNDFEMPMILTPETSADYIFKGLQSSKFDISFPPLFATIMKLFRVLPDCIFFKIAQKMLKRERK